MKSRLGIISVLLLLTPQCFAAECRTCKGKQCQERIVTLKACARFSSRLAFETPVQVKKSLQYGCLKLEYSRGESNEVIEKCIITENIAAFCGNIAKTLNYTACSVNAPMKQKTGAVLAQPVAHVFSSFRNSTIFIERAGSSNLNPNAEHMGSLPVKKNFPIDTDNMLSSSGPIPEENTSDLASIYYGSKTNTALRDADISSTDGSVNELASKIPVSLYYNVPKQIRHFEFTTLRYSENDMMENSSNVETYLFPETSRKNIDKTVVHSDNLWETESSITINNRKIPTIIDANANFRSDSTGMSNEVTSFSSGETTTDHMPLSNEKHVIEKSTTKNQSAINGKLFEAKIPTKSYPENVTEGYINNRSHSKGDSIYKEIEPAVVGVWSESSDRAYNISTNTITPYLDYVSISNENPAIEGARNDNDSDAHIYKGKTDHQAASTGEEPNVEVWTESSDRDSNINKNEVTPDLNHISMSNETSIIEPATNKNKPASDIYKFTTDQQIVPNDEVLNTDFNTRHFPDNTVHSTTDGTANSNQGIINEETDPAVEMWFESNHKASAISTSEIITDLYYVSLSNGATSENERNSEIYDGTTTHAIDSYEESIYEESEPTVEVWSISNNGATIISTSEITSSLDNASMSDETPLIAGATNENEPDSNIYKSTTVYQTGATEEAFSQDLNTRSFSENTRHSYIDDRAHFKPGNIYGKTEPNEEVWSESNIGISTIVTGEITSKLDDERPGIESATRKNEPDSDIYNGTTVQQRDPYKKVSNTDFITTSIPGNAAHSYAADTADSKPDGMYKEPESTVEVGSESSHGASTTSTSETTPDFGSIFVSNETPLIGRATNENELDFDSYKGTAVHQTASTEEAFNKDLNTRGFSENTTQSYTDNRAPAKSVSTYEKTEPSEFEEVRSEPNIGVSTVIIDKILPELDYTAMSNESPETEGATAEYEPDSNIYDGTTIHQIGLYEEVSNTDSNTKSFSDNATHNTPHSVPDSAYGESEPAIEVWFESSDGASSIGTSTITSELYYISISSETPLIEGATNENDPDSDIYRGTTIHQKAPTEDVTNKDLNTRSFSENITHSYTDDRVHSNPGSIYEQTKQSERAWSELSDGASTISISEKAPDLDYIPMSNETPLTERTTTGNEPGPDIYMGTMVHQTPSTEEVSIRTTFSESKIEVSTIIAVEITSELEFRATSYEIPRIKGAAIENAPDSNIYEGTTIHQIDPYQDVSKTDFHTASDPENCTQSSTDDTAHSEPNSIYEDTETNVWSESSDGVSTISANEITTDFDYIAMSNETPVIEGRILGNEQNSDISEGTTAYHSVFAEEIFITKRFPENVTGSKTDDVAETTSENIYEEATSTEEIGSKPTDKVSTNSASGSDSTEMYYILPSNEAPTTEEITTENAVKFEFFMGAPDHQSDCNKKVSKAEFTSISYPENTTEIIEDAKTAYTKEVGFGSNIEGLTTSRRSEATITETATSQNNLEFEYQLQSTEKLYNTEIITARSVVESTTETLISNKKNQSTAEHMYEGELNDNSSTADIVDNAILTITTKSYDLTPNQETENSGNTADVTGTTIWIKESMPDIDLERTSSFVEYTATSSEDTQSGFTTKVPSNPFDIDVTASVSSDGETTSVLPLDHSENASDSYSNSSASCTSNIKIAVLSFTVSFVIYVNIF